jgi:hypothetical protein
MIKAASNSTGLTSQMVFSQNTGLKYDVNLIELSLNGVLFLEEALSKNFIRDNKFFKKKNTEKDNV